MVARMFIRDLAAVARLPNLPTVWSNAICAYLIGHSLVASALAGTPVVPPFSPALLALAAAAASLLYLCGTFLNDAADAAFDARFRPQRPVPAGRLSRALLLNCGLACGVAGIALAFFLGPFSLAAAGLLATAILAYTWLHKRGPWGIPFMALCRALLYPMAGLAGVVFSGPDLAAAWQVLIAMGLLQGCWVAGLSLVARGEATGPAGARTRAAALVLMSIPPLAPAALLVWWFAQDGLPARIDLPLLAWAMGSTASLAWLWHAARGLQSSPGLFVRRALAGIALVDLVPVALLGYPAPWVAIVPLTAFALAILLQKWLPAT
jgi:4-hydroxybenzoate polyprenyltransferase